MTAPANDDFANAELLSGLGELVSGVDTSGATLETGEPEVYDTLGEYDTSIGATVWFGWSPPADGDFTISLEGSTFDTVLAAYTSTGSTLADLSLVYANDDNGSGGYWSKVDLFSASSATTYYFQVGGYGGDSGLLTLTTSVWTEPPPPVGPDDGDYEWEPVFEASGEIFFSGGFWHLQAADELVRGQWFSRDPREGWDYLGHLQGVIYGGYLYTRAFTSYTLSPYGKVCVAIMVGTDESLTQAAVVSYQTEPAVSFLAAGAMPMPSFFAGNYPVGVEFFGGSLLVLMRSGHLYEAEDGIGTGGETAWSLVADLSSLTTEFDRTSFVEAYSFSQMGDELVITVRGSYDHPTTNSLDRDETYIYTTTAGSLASWTHRSALADGENASSPPNTYPGGYYMNTTTGVLFASENLDGPWSEVSPSPWSEWGAEAAPTYSTDDGWVVPVLSFGGLSIVSGPTLESLELETASPLGFTTYPPAPFTDGSEVIVASNWLLMRNRKEAGWGIALA